MKGTLLAGRYRIEEEIGRGGMATVYSAFDLSLERRVAVKVLHPELANDPNTVARFRAEAQAAAKLSHPSIAQIYDTGEEKGCYFIVMEYLPEPDLKSVIRNFAPLPPHKVAEMAIQACEALGYAHQHGLVHRDVKPHNILFTADGRVKLVDFGIAAAVGERGPQSVLVGSAHYLSPEEVRGNPPTPQSDIYSLGVVMYECLTGQTPFHGETVEAVLSRRLTEAPPPLRALNPALPPAAEHIVMKAMARDPNQRYQSAGELLGDLRRLALGAPLETTPPPLEATKTLVLPRPPQSVSSASIPPPPSAVRSPVSAPKTQKEDMGWLWGVGGFLAGVVALVILVFVFQRLFYQGPQQAAYVIVPGVTGLSREQAEQALSDAGLTLGEVTERPDAERPPGTVIAQTPAMGERIPAGTAVDLVVAVPKDKEATIVPVINVVGLPLKDAQANLQRVRLQVGKVEEVYDDEVPAGIVISQDIPPDTEVREGQSVGLKVSKGPEPPTVEATEMEPPDEDRKPSALEPQEVDPDFAVMPVGEPSPEDPSIRRFKIMVRVQGTQSAQHIQIILKDDRNVRQIVQEGFYDPGQVIEKEVTTHGSAIFEVWRDRKFVGRAPLPLTSETEAENGA
ncbi:MAG: Stk1 family PASTA domain-containing Ser/Thr kinase [Candidatus Zipacnadales bacterium]